MKRFHVSVAVADLDRSTAFYTHLFGEGPTLAKDDYAKWMLEDPRINFSINKSRSARGVNHVGLQADTLEELAQIQARLKDAEAQTVEQADARCCYANSSKTWVRDPDELAWETFVTHGEITEYGSDLRPDSSDDCRKADNGPECCA